MPSGSFRAGSGPSLHQRRPPPLTPSVSCPAGTFCQRCSQSQPFAPGTSCPSGRQVLAVRREPWHPVPHCPPAAALPTGPRPCAASSSLAPGILFKRKRFLCLFSNWEMRLRKYQDEPGDPGKLSETLASSKPRPGPQPPVATGEVAFTPSLETQAAAVAQSVPVPSMFT